MEPPDTPPPAGVELDRQHGLTLAFDDGTQLTFGLEELRVNCPCAECRGLREQGLAVWPKPASPRPLAATGAELVGGWGVTITWNDGHNTGIYPWSLLRAWRADDLADG
jgi:ATP-binding protein involved in chromosome partitioning